MDSLFSTDDTLLWTVVLALLLFLPVRHLVWILSVRRAERKAPTDEAERRRLKRRAGVTSALLCFVFAFVYILNLMTVSR